MAFMAFTRFYCSQIALVQKIKVAYNKNTMDILQELQGEKIEINTQDMIYRGTLLGAGKSQVYLQMFIGQLELPMTVISDLHAFSKKIG